MSILDIFNNDAFSNVSMLKTVDSMEFKPSLLGSMGVFTPNPIRTEAVAIESRNNVLNLVKTSQRGSPLEQRSNDNRTIRDFRTTRIAKGDRILASELSFLRDHGETEQVVQLQQEIARRMNGPGGLMDDIDYTMENMRLGAIQGKVLDSDATVIYDWFSEFNITQAAEIAFNLAGAAEGDLRTKCTQVARAMKRASGGTWTPSTRVHALCGDTFWDELVHLKELREIYRNRSDSQYVQGGGAYESISYGGILWENYQGSDDGTTVGIHTDKVKFFPVNAPGAFLEVFAPGEQFTQLGQLGQIAYPIIVRDRDRDSYVDIETYSYPLHVCTRPGMLQSGKRQA